MRRCGKVAAGDMALLAAELEVSRATAFRLITLFRNGGTVMSLVERKPGRPDRWLDDDYAGAYPMFATTVALNEQGINDSPTWLLYIGRGRN